MQLQLPPKFLWYPTANDCVKSTLLQGDGDDGDSDDEEEEGEHSEEGLSELNGQSSSTSENSPAAVLRRMSSGIGAVRFGELTGTGF
jgi:hypothetical protein